jgi:hypothetical protein
VGTQGAGETSVGAIIVIASILTLHELPFWRCEDRPQRCRYRLIYNDTFPSWGFSISRFPIVALQQ